MTTTTYGLLYRLLVKAPVFFPPEGFLKSITEMRWKCLLFWHCHECISSFHTSYSYFLLWTHIAICFYTERLWSSTVTLDICSFITASHRVTNRGMEEKERVNISCGRWKLRLLCDILSCHCAVEGVGWLSRYSECLWAGRSGDRVPVGTIFSARPDRPWGPPSLL